MKNFKNLLLVSILIVTVFCQVAMGQCSVEDILPCLFSVEKMQFDDQEFLIKTVNQVDSGICYSDGINNNNQYIDYLLTNFSDRSKSETLLSISDSNKLQEQFIKSIQSDQTFVKLLSQLLQADKNTMKDSVSMDELMNVAVKFFTITKITEEGYYSGKVCTGINLLKTTEENRNPHVEAFCFSSILQSYLSNNWGLREKFANAIRELYKINMGIDKDERLLRAQGALLVEMSQDQELRNRLISDYEAKSNNLPFVLNTKH